MSDPYAKVPRFIVGADVTRFPLSPLEGFVISLIDGVAAVAEIADLSGLDQEATYALITRLIDIGLVEWARERVSLPCS